MVELLLSVEWNDTAIISSIVGVVGTILGTVIGFLLSVLSRSGRQNIICKGIELSYYYGVNDIGDRVYRKESNFDGKVPERTKLSLELLITNSSEIFGLNDCATVVRTRSRIKRRIHCFLRENSRKFVAFSYQRKTALISVIGSI